MSVQERLRGSKGAEWLEGTDAERGSKRFKEERSIEQACHRAPSFFREETLAKKHTPIPLLQLTGEVRARKKHTKAPVCWLGANSK